MSQVSSLTVRRVASMRARRLALTAAVLAVGVHLWGLYRPSSPPSTAWLPFSDKIEHTVGFALPVLMILLVRRLAGAGRRGTVILVAAIFVAHAVVSELIQHFFYARRTGDPRDVLADLIGVGLGVGAYLIIDRRSRPAVAS